MIYETDAPMSAENARRMADAWRSRPTSIVHRREDGALCWGGPYDGRVLAVPPSQRRLLYIEPEPVSYSIAEGPEFLDTLPPAKTYRVERFNVRWPMQAETWEVLIDEGVSVLEVERRLQAWLAFCRFVADHPALPRPEPASDVVLSMADARSLLPALAHDGTAWRRLYAAISAAQEGPS